MATIAMLAPVGCSLGADEEPQPASGPPAQIAATVDRLERAVAERDFATICERLLTATARRRAGGDDCVPLLRSAAAGVRRPSIEVKAIDVEGTSATVEVRTMAAGQARLTDKLQLRRQGTRWLIEALG